MEICTANRGSGIALIWIWNYWERQWESWSRLKGKKPPHPLGVSVVNQSFGGEGVVPHRPKVGGFDLLRSAGMEQDTDTPQAVGWGSSRVEAPEVCCAHGSDWQWPQHWGFLSKKHLVRNIPYLKKVAFMEFLLLFLGIASQPFSKMEIAHYFYCSFILFPSSGCWFPPPLGTARSGCSSDPVLRLWKAAQTAQGGNSSWGTWNPASPYLCSSCCHLWHKSPTAQWSLMLSLTL